jgi:hypothetical protein
MREFASRSLGSTSDLVVLAPWKPGVVEADDLITYRTRLALTFRTLFEIRRAAREQSLRPLLSDPIERLEQIHSFRIRATEAGMLLAVTYDHQWEPYIRALKEKAGPFLDLLLINCAGYRTTRECSLGEWAAWIREREQPSDYFYAATPLTVADLAWLQQAERRLRAAPSVATLDPALAGRPSRPVVETIAEARKAEPVEATRQAANVLLAMFRLTRFHGAELAGPLREDALTLLLATKALLAEWALPTPPPPRFAQALAWLQQPVPPASPLPAPWNPDRAQVQKGLLTRFDGAGTPVTHGCLLLLRVRDAAQAALALAGLPLSTEAEADAGGDGVFRTLALTASGLARLGVPAPMRAGLGDAFNEGAAGRAGQVGDTRAFHPARWQLPRRTHGDAGATVPLETVDAVILLRTAASPDLPRDPLDEANPLASAIAAVAALDGIDLLHAEGLGPARPDQPGVDHLGFLDGISQPVLGGTAGRYWSDDVPAGSLLLGPGGPVPEAFHCGAFLAIRKMTLDADAFETLVTEAALATGLGPVAVKAALLGRMPDGGAPVPAGSGPNDFRFDSDPDGAHCPFQSHIRRTNPRDPVDPAPRIMRRGMSFGPPAGTQGNAPRGSLFMASCADLAQQYEVLLRWVNGANSSRLGSWASDPICGPAVAGEPRILVFPDDTLVRRIEVDAGKPVARLDWSLYTLVPPVSWVRGLAAPKPAPAEDLVAAGTRMLGALQQLKAPPAVVEAAWRAALRDPGAERTGATDALWAAVRAHHGGLLRTPIGVLVGSLALVQAVLRDDGRRFSVRGAGARLAETIGSIHLGWDSYRADHAREAPPINAALKAVSRDDAFAATRDATARRVATLFEGPVDLIAGLLEPVTAATFPAWFGLPDGRFVHPGGQDWRDIRGREACFPGDYWNSARDAFIPIPSSEAGRRGRIEGPILRQKARAWIEAVGRDKLPGTIAAALAKETHALPSADDLARAITGCMVGAVATTLGNGARIIDALAAGELARLAFDWRAAPKQDVAAADALFGPSVQRLMQSRPVPELLWRVVEKDGLALGDMTLMANDILILGIDSASAEERLVASGGAHIAFGQTPETPPTTHGCPAREMALGMILGWLAGLADAATVRPGGAPFLLNLSPRR